ncbi:MAG TPA: hypothetical protein VKF35_00025 [Hyphomicrobiaceae bacterium]|nr:hypothetical protein [Hyphomicrobiaceae bacterium]
MPSGIVFLSNLAGRQSASTSAHLAKKREELARVLERLQAPDVRPGLAKELHRHVTIPEREIAGLR